MSASNFDQLDALIALSAKGSIDREVEQFRQMKITKKPPQRLTRKIERLIRKEDTKVQYQTLFKVMKVAGIACLMAISITFTACMCISEVREAMWDAVVEWYDDYISIHFQHKEPLTDATPVLLEPPKEIEKVNAPTYVPYGYMISAESSKRSFYQEYYDGDGNFVFSFEQGLRDQKFIEIDNNNSDVSKISLNHADGIFVISDDNMMSVIWQDEYYSYIVQGVFELKDDIIRIANSVEPIK